MPARKLFLGIGILPIRDAGRPRDLIARPEKQKCRFQSEMPADSILAARSHARISASPASRTATQNLTDFTGTLYPPIGGRHDQVSMVEVDRVEPQCLRVRSNPNCCRMLQCHDRSKRSLRIRKRPNRCAAAK